MDYVWPGEPWDSQLSDLPPGLKTSEAVGEVTLTFQL